MSASSVPDGDMRRGPKFRRRAEARPDEVLDAALDLFIEKGFAATRVEDIAKRAGLSKGAVYLYFPSKEKILEGIVHRAVVPIAEHALSFVKNYEGDPRLAITAVMKMLATRLRPSSSPSPSSSCGGYGFPNSPRCIGARCWTGHHGLLARASTRAICVRSTRSLRSARSLTHHAPPHHGGDFRDRPRTASPSTGSSTTTSPFSSTGSAPEAATLGAS